MTPEQREEIEKAILNFEEEIGSDGWVEMRVNTLAPLVQFARQQLNLRVDGEKLREEVWRRWAIKFNPHDMSLIEALVLECLTTTPEEKE